MLMHTYVYVCVYMCIYIYMHTYICVYIYIYIRYTRIPLAHAHGEGVDVLVETVQEGDAVDDGLVLPRRY